MKTKKNKIKRKTLRCENCGFRLNEEKLKDQLFSNNESPVQGLRRSPRNRKERREVEIALQNDKLEEVVKDIKRKLADEGRELDDEEAFCEGNKNSLARKNLNYIQWLNHVESNKVKDKTSCESSLKKNANSSQIIDEEVTLEETTHIPYESKRVKDEARATVDLGNSIDILLKEARKASEKATAELKIKSSALTSIQDYSD